MDRLRIPPEGRDLRRPGLAEETNVKISSDSKRRVPHTRSYFARCGIPQILTFLRIEQKTFGLSAVESHISRKTSEMWGTHRPWLIEF